MSRFGQLLLDSARGVIAVKGNIGVGKTRFVREAVNKLADKEIAWGDCSYLADYVAYYPIRELVKYKITKHRDEVLQDIEPVSRVALSRLVPALSDILQEKAAGKNIFLNKRKFYEAVEQIMKFGRTEKIIVIDNLQWIDQGSTRILFYLIGKLKSEPITWILIYRTDEETEVLKDFLAALRRHETIIGLSLQSFSRAGVVELISSVLEEKPTENLISFIMSETGGNPYYIEELIRNLVLDEHLIPDGKAWYFKEPESETVPKSIEDIALVKFLGLEADTQRVVSIASIIGWFDVAFIKEMTGFQPTKIVESIQNVQSTGLVKYSEDRIEFADDISRYAIYNSISSKSDVISIHQKIGDWLKERAGARERAVVDDLAFHYYHARDIDKGVRFCRAAAEAAKNKFAYQVAIKYIHWAIDLLVGSEKRMHHTQRVELKKELHGLQSLIEKEKTQ